MKKRVLALILCIGLAAVMATSRAEEAFSPDYDDVRFRRVNTECVASVGGDVSALALHGSFLYVAQGATLTTYDISDKSQPRVTNWQRFSGFINKAATYQNTLYLSTNAWDDGVKVLDVSDPGKPRLVAMLPESNGYLTMERWGRFLIVDEAGKYGRDCRIYDLAEPLKPALIHEFKHNNEQLCTDGESVYVTKGGSLIGNELRLLRLDGKTTTTFARASFPNGTEMQSTFERKGDAVEWIADSYHIDLKLKPGAGVYIFTDADEEGPTSAEVDYTEVKKALFPDKEKRGCFDCDGRIAVAEESESVKLHEATNAAHSQEVGHIETYGSILQVRQAGTRAYAVTESGAVLILNCSRGPQLSVIGKLPAGTADGILGIEEHALYLCKEGFTHIYDVADPNAPRKLALLDAGPNVMSIDGKRLYMLRYNEQVSVAEWSGTSTLKVQHEWKLPERADDMARAGNIVYAANSTELYVIDAAGKSDGEVKRLRLFTNDLLTVELKRAGSILYAVGMMKGGGTVLSSYKTFDVTNPLEPELIASGMLEDEAKPHWSAPAQPVRYLSLPHSEHGNMRWMAMDLLDFSNAKEPKYVATYAPLHHFTTHAAMGGDYILRPDEEGGLLVIVPKGN